MIFSVIGGDLRIVKLVNLLVEEGNKVYVYGLDNASELKISDNIVICKTMLEAIKNSEIVIGPIPFSSNSVDINAPFCDKKISICELMNHINAKTLIAGGLTHEIYELANDEYVEIIDIMKREELAVLNTISTAEGTIEIIISNTNKILHGSNVLILGFGRIGKVLARKLFGLNAKVTCAARKEEDMAWIKAYGYNGIDIKNIGEELKQYDIIVNTVPNMILNSERIQYLNEDVLIIDLASNPGGVDRKAIKDRKLKFIWALALPGKVAPNTTAEFIKDTIFSVLKEIN